MNRLTAQDVEALAEELTALCAGGQIQKIVGRRFGGVALTIRTPGKTHYLEIVATPDVQALYLEEQRPKRAAQLSPFVRALRAALDGGRLRAIRALGGERLAFLEIGQAEQPPFRLAVELFGSRANLYFVDAAGILRDACDAMRIRTGLERGAAYTPPPARPGGAPRAKGGLGLTALPADGSRSRVLAESFVPLEQLAWCERYRTTTRQRLEQSRKKLSRRLAALERDLAATDEAELFQRRAEALVALGRPQERGRASIVATDYRDETCGSIEVPLDPSKTVGENAQQAFKRARKLRRGEPVLRERIDATRRELAQLDSLAAALSAASDPDALEAIGAQLEAQQSHIGVRRAAQTRVGGKREPRPPYRRFQSATGKTILVGRSARENDELSLRVASGRDLWFHAEATSGSHVVLRLARGDEADGESLLDAATLAAYFSRARKHVEVNVLSTRCADVRKPRGAKPGAVLAARTETRWIRIEPERIARLLGSESVQSATVTATTH